MRLVELLQSIAGTSEVIDGKFKSEANFGWNVYCISKRAVPTCDCIKVRQVFLQHTLAPSNAIWFQVIGDSGTTFSPCGTQAAKRILEESLHLAGQYMLLWGYTGRNDVIDGGEDANQVVNDWIDADPEARSPFCVASIVDRGTIQAITKAGYTGPLRPSTRHNFIVVTGQADFGDDIGIADPMTDQLLVLEGGVQSFTQIVNCLSNGAKVVTVDGLRRPDTIPRFSASSFMRELVDANVSRIETFADVRERYVTASLLPQSTQFEVAWTRFVSLGLKIRLSALVTCIRA